MKRVFKKNQIIITALAVLIAVAGYINYMGSIKNNAKASNKDVKQTAYKDGDTVEPGEAIMANSVAIENKVTELKLSREQTRAKNLESLYQVINDAALDSQTKQSAVETLNKIATTSELELALELSLEAKGFDNVIVSVSDAGVDVMVNMSTVDDVNRAQIEDIVVRKAGVKLENVVITPIVTEISAEQ